MTTSETDERAAKDGARKDSGRKDSAKKDLDRETMREELDLWISGTEEPDEVELWDISSTDEGAQEMREEEGALRLNEQRGVVVEDDYTFDEELPDDERMIVNMGPQHPSTHGVIRFVVKMDGERVVECEPLVGYMHRGAEKLFEVRD